MNTAPHVSCASTRAHGARRKGLLGGRRRLENCILATSELSKRRCCEHRPAPLDWTRPRRSTVMRLCGLPAVTRAYQSDSKSDCRSSRAVFGPRAGPPTGEKGDPSLTGGSLHIRRRATLHRLASTGGCWPVGHSASYRCHSAFKSSSTASKGSARTTSVPAYAATAR